MNGQKAEIQTETKKNERKFFLKKRTKRERRKETCLKKMPERKAEKQKIKNNLTQRLFLNTLDDHCMLKILCGKPQQLQNVKDMIPVSIRKCRN